MALNLANTAIYFSPEKSFCFPAKYWYLFFVFVVFDQEKVRIALYVQKAALHFIDGMIFTIRYLHLLDPKVFFPSLTVWFYLVQRVIVLSTS